MLSNYISLNLLNLLNDLAIVYDGPGYLSPVLRSNSGFLQTSTFQCVVQIYVHQNRSNQKHLSFTSYGLPVTKIPTIYKANIIQINTCVLLLNAIHSNKINATITAMTYKDVDYNIPHCKYGGMTSGEYFNKKYMNSSSMCQPHDGSRKQSRSYYSYNNSANAVSFVHEVCIKMIKVCSYILG